MGTPSFNHVKHKKKAQSVALGGFCLWARYWGGMCVHENHLFCVFLRYFDDGGIRNKRVATINEGCLCTIAEIISDSYFQKTDKRYARMSPVNMRCIF